MALNVMCYFFETRCIGGPSGQHMSRLCADYETIRSAQVVEHTVHEIKSSILQSGFIYLTSGMSCKLISYL